DFLSNLPDDCRFEIFHFLDRENLDVMKRVSRNFYDFLSQSFFEKVKEEADELIISENYSRHAFHMIMKGREKHISYRMNHPSVNKRARNQK
ncbi:hypothetical protein PFISCL1PPCAC_2613, partial [Pristionchus fissidentatus]